MFLSTFQSGMAPWEGDNSFQGDNMAANASQQQMVSVNLHFLLFEVYQMTFNCCQNYYSHEFTYYHKI